MLGVELPERPRRRGSTSSPSGRRSRPSSRSSPRCRDEDRVPARAAVRRADVGAAARARSTARDARRRSTRSATSFDEWALGVLQQVPGTLRRRRRLDGRLHRGGDRAARARAARGARARRLARRRRPARARAAARGVDPDRRASRAARGSGRPRRRTSSRPARPTESSSSAHRIAAEQDPEGLVRAITAIRDRPDSTEAVTSGIPLLVVARRADPLIPVAVVRGARGRARRPAASRCSRAAATCRTGSGPTSSTGCSSAFVASL